MNIYIIAGVCTQDPKLTYTSTGKPKVFNMIQIPRFTGKEIVNDYIGVSFFEKVAEKYAQGVKKGQKVIITGRIGNQKMIIDGDVKYHLMLVGDKFESATSHFEEELLELEE